MQTVHQPKPTVQSYYYGFQFVYAFMFAKFRL